MKYPPRTRLWPTLVNIIVLATGAQAFAVNASLPYFDSKDLTPFWRSASEMLRKSVHIGPFEAIDHRGATITNDVLKDHVTLINFFFAECAGICPMMMQSIKEIETKLKDANQEVQLLSFSVRPEQDSTAKLKKYADAMKIKNPHWHLLTGKKTEIFRVGKSMLKADGAIGSQKSDDVFIHNRNIYLIDINRKLRGIYDTSDQANLAKLVDDIASLRSE